MFQITRQLVILVIIIWKLFAIHGNDIPQIVEIRNVLKYKLYFNMIRRRMKKRGCIQDYPSKRTHLLLLILLSGDVETNPGPVSFPCPRCSQRFDRRSRLDAHLSKQQLLTCGHSLRKKVEYTGMYTLRIFRIFAYSGTSIRCIQTKCEYTAYTGVKWEIYRVYPRLYIRPFCAVYSASFKNGGSVSKIEVFWTFFKTG